MIDGIRDLVVESHRLLDRLEIPHAFGGAIALGFHSRMRSTLDADINVFASMARASEVAEAFAPLGLTPQRAVAEWVPMAGVRLAHEQRPLAVDLFFSLDESYEAVRQRVVWAEFGEGRTPVPLLSAEDLVTFKLSFGRPKDWVDIRSLVDDLPGLDVGQVEDLVLHLRGPSMHPRLARLRAMLATRGGGG